MFTTPLELKEDPRPDYWAVCSPLVWSDTGLLISVPEGFITDLASIPRLLRNLPMLDPDGYSRSAAVLHDWLYRTHQMSRADSDGVLRRAIISRGGSATTARIFWMGVRLGGNQPWAANPNGPQPGDFETSADYAKWRLGNGHPLD